MASIYASFSIQRVNERAPHFKSGWGRLNIGWVTHYYIFREAYIFLTVNDERTCGRPLSRDVHFRVTRMQSTTGADLHVPVCHVSVVL